MTAETIARARHYAMHAGTPANVPRWETMTPRYRQDAVRAVEHMMADGWVFTPPK